MIRFHDACGTTGKTVAARLLPDTDLIEGIEEVCKKNNIKHAYVTCFAAFPQDYVRPELLKKNARQGG